MHLRFVLAVALPLMALHCPASGDTPTHATATLEVWGYGSRQRDADSSPLNPSNSVLRVQKNLSVMDVRLNLRVQTDSTETIVQPRWLGQSPDTNAAKSQWSLRQALTRVKSDSGSTWTVGRQVMAWGPANFRSPSSPFYFDSGKLNPLREVGGIDLLRYQQVFEPYSLGVGYVVGTSAQPGADDGDSLFIKLDDQGPDYLLSANVARIQGRKPFIGTFGQIHVNEAVLLYGEYGRGQRSDALEVNPSGQPPLQTKRPSPSAASWLVGTSYTLLNGQVASLEYLHDAHGLGNAAQRDYFRILRESADLATGSPDPTLRARQAAVLGLAASRSASLLGRDYLSLLWQSNPQEPALYWRMATHVNLHDRSRQLNGYLEKSVSAHVSLFANVTRNAGRTDSEFMSTVRSVVTLGLKAVIF